MRRGWAGDPCSRSMPIPATSMAKLMHILIVRFVGEAHIAFSDSRLSSFPRDTVLDYGVGVYLNE
jgi:hypothetical protein